jgi:hypothetical protein
MVRNIIVVFTVVVDLVVAGAGRASRAVAGARVVGFAIPVKRQAKHPIPTQSPEEGLITV